MQYGGKNHNHPPQKKAPEPGAFLLLINLLAEHPQNPVTCGKKPNKMQAEEIIAKNKERNLVEQTPYHPETGEGSNIGNRVRIDMPDAPIPVQYIPEQMNRVEMVSLLKKYGSIDLFIEKELKKKADEELRDEVWKRWLKIRIKYDFEFWSVMFVKIKDKTGERDVPFRLNRPQRRLLSELEAMREKGRPIRIILLKARQWGGSTLVQIYMAWIQLVHRHNWNSVICAHLKDSALNIKGMYSKLLENYPPWLLSSDAPLRFRPFEKMGNTSIIDQTKCRITIGSAETPESIRGNDAVMAHLSEVAFWPATPQKTPESLVRSVCGSVALIPYSVIVMESTANGTGNYFHKECQRAKRGESDKKFVFVPWYEIEIYRSPIDDYEKFVETMTSYEKYLWERGATLEAISWYRKKRKEYAEHADMMAEYPSDDVEAFNYSGDRVFDARLVEKMRRECRDPEQTGEIYGKAEQGRAALDDVKFSAETNGRLKIWSQPDKSDQITGRYITVVDIGGRSDKADYSVIAVFDRYWMMHGGVPEIAAQWRGHCDHDLLAWKAAQIATYYNNALLVIESNTLETENYDGGDTEYILETIADTYKNLYSRPPANMIRGSTGIRWGFHMNRSTKALLVNHQIRMLREGGYIERDMNACYEHDVYERKPNGAYGAMDGHHDDILITRCIGTYICYTEPLPSKKHENKVLRKQPLNESSI